MTRPAAIGLKHALVLSLAAVSLGAVQGTDMLPGRYEGTIQTTIAGEAEPPEKDDQCLTADDVKRIDRWVASTLGRECSVSERNVSGSTQRFTVRCASDAPGAVSRVELTTGRESLDVTIRSSEQAAGETIEAVMTIKAKRVGDCAK